MEGKQEIAFEHIVDERIYKFTLPHGAPLGEAYQASVMFLETMVRMIQDHADKTLKKDEQEETSTQENKTDDESSK